MAKVNGKYETIFIVNPNLGEEAITAIVEKFKALIADNGTVVSVDDWGKRRMAYEINDLREELHRQDPNAFYIIQEGVHLSDNFIRRLSE